MKKLKYLVFLLCFVFTIGEIVGRYYGLHQYPLYVQSNDFEYIHAPNQDLSIYGNHFMTNEFSMRSAPIDAKKDTTVVLFIGDSVINGGNLMGHENLATTILEQKLSADLNKNIRVYNISGGSWGPDNAEMYIKKNGTFDADFIVLVVSSHDAYDNITHQPIVGIHPQFPKENYLLAWGKLIERGWQQVEKRLQLSQKSQKVKNADLGIGQAQIFNSGFQYFHDLSLELGIPLLVYLHPNKKELAEKKTGEFGDEIIAFCTKNKIHFIDELTTGLKKDGLRDYIHYSQIGHKHLANTLHPILFEQLKD